VGMFSSLHHLMYVLDFSLRNNRTAVPALYDTWPLASECNSYPSSFFCYFLPISFCDEDSLDTHRRGRTPVLSTEDVLSFRVVQYDEALKDPFWLHYGGYHYGWMGWDVNPLIDEIPQKYLDMDPSLTAIWWRAQILNYITRPIPEILRMVEKVKTELNWNNDDTEKIIGLHIRGTDKLWDEMRPISFVRYIERLLLLKKWFNVSTVFVSTDDPDFINLLENLDQENEEEHLEEKTQTQQERIFGSSGWTEKRLKNALRQFKFLYIRWESRTREGDVPHFRGEVNDSAFNGTLASQLAIVNALLLSYCDFLVGSYSSNMSRAAYELLIARRGPHSVGVSLDIPLSERVN